ncbi:MAG: cysteine--tRNA ligase [bacterium]
MALRLHNTLTKKVEEFVSRDAGKAALYVCGLTVYDHAHLGHMRAAIVFDVLRRYLEWKGLQVTHVQNFTDVDDRIIQRAQNEGVPFDEVTEKYITEYRQALEALNVLPPHVEPRASRHIPDMIEMIARLVEQGYAYYAEGDVYFDVTKRPGYGKLSGRVLEDLRAGARVEPGEFKRHPADFALWKRTKPGEPNWESPWGRGRPGWHIECSAMSLKYLGMGFDIHGGGDDLIFPHHENEIAQSESYTGKEPFARYWIHNAMVMVRGEKMSKSLHNYFAVMDALRVYPADAIRYALVSVHYRKPIEVDEERFADAARAVERLRVALTAVDAVMASVKVRDGSGQPSGKLVGAVQRARSAFESTMDDDLNTAGALAAIFELVAEMNRAADEVQKGQIPAALAQIGLSMARATFLELTGLLGLAFKSAPIDQEVQQKVLKIAQAFRSTAVHSNTETLISNLLDVRERARASKDFSTADQIRKLLAEAGIIVEDLPTGPRWRVVSAAGSRASSGGGDG